MEERELLDAYLDHELTRDERDAVDEALADSPELAAELAELAAVRSSLRDLPDVEPPAGFFEGMLERGSADPATALPEGVASLSGARTKNEERVRVKRSLASRATSIIAAAAVFLLVLGFGSGISAIERVPALDDFASRHAEALTAMDTGEAAETERFHAMPMQDVKDLGPDSTDSMDMMGAYGTDDKIVQLIYSDEGGNIVSVFRQDGYVKVDDMPEADAMEMAGDDAWRLENGGYDTLVVDRGGITYTLIGDMSASSAMKSLADDLPETNNGIVGKVQAISRTALKTVGIS